MQMNDIKGNPIASLHIGYIPHLQEERLAIQQGDSVIGVPLDSIYKVADTLVMVAELLERRADPTRPHA